MIIKDIVSLARYSELAGVAVKEDIDAVVAFINLAMIELYTRFPIRIEEHVVTVVEGTSTYEMPTDFMYATRVNGESTKTGTLKVTTLSVNEDDDSKGVVFTDWNTMQIDEPDTDEFIYITYVTKPTSITTDDAEDGVTELDLPDTLVDALLSYIGYRAHLGIRSDAQSENNSQWLRFERSCQKAIELGVAFPMETMTMPTRLGTRGFA